VMIMNVILLGPPGVGKGTAARLLSEKYNLPHISTGDILRTEIASNTELGKKAQEYVDVGKLVPDELVTEIIRAKLTSPEAAKGYFLDGYPRTIAQANALQTFSKMDRVLNLSAPRKVIVERIMKRGEGRSDDSSEIVNQRISEYEEKTIPLIDFYRNEGLLKDIDATKNIEGVVAQCIEILEEN